MLRRAASGVSPVQRGQAGCVTIPDSLKRCVRGRRSVFPSPYPGGEIRLEWNTTWLQLNWDTRSREASSFLQDPGDSMHKTSVTPALGQEDSMESQRSP